MTGLLILSPARLARFLPPAGPLEGVSQQEFDLRVETPQVVVGPAFHLVEYAVVNSDQEGLAFAHQPAFMCRAFPC